MNTGAPAIANRTSPDSEVIYGRLRERIQAGTYPASGRLPSETHIAREFDVSHPAVREPLGRPRGVGERVVPEPVGLGC